MLYYEMLGRLMDNFSGGHLWKRNMLIAGITDESVKVYSLGIGLRILHLPNRSENMPVNN